MADELEMPYINSLNVQRGEMVYQDIIACKRGHASQSMAEFFEFMSIMNKIQRGYRSMVGRVSSPAVRKLTLNLGGEILNKTYFKREDMKD